MRNYSYLQFNLFSPSFMWLSQNGHFLNGLKCRYSSSHNQFKQPLKACIPWWFGLYFCKAQGSKLTEQFVLHQLILNVWQWRARKRVAVEEAACQWRHDLVSVFSQQLGESLSCVAFKPGCRGRCRGCNSCFTAAQYQRCKAGRCTCDWPWVNLCWLCLLCGCGRKLELVYSVWASVRCVLTVKFTFWEAFSQDA